MTARNVLKEKKSVVLISFIFLFTTILLSSKSGTSVADFLRINHDAYITSIGEGAYGIEGYNLNNPASMAFYNRNILSVNYFPWLMSDIKYYFAGSVITTTFGNMGIAGAYLNYGDIQGYNNYQEKLNLPVSGEILGIFSFSKEIKKTVPLEIVYGSIGANLKFVKSQLAEYSAETVAIDLGLLYKLRHIEKYPFLNNFSLGLSYKNLGSKMKFVTVENYLPESISFGISYNDLDRIIFVADVSIPYVTSVVYSCGVSFVPIKPIICSLGYRHSDKVVHNGLRFGFSVSIFDTIFEYSYTPSVEFHPVQKIGIKFTFDYLSKEKMFKTHLLEQLELAKEYYRRRNYSMAKSVINDIYLFYPENPVAKKLEEQIDDKIKKYSIEKENFVKRHLKKAEVAIRNNNVIEAQRSFEIVETHDPNNPYLEDIRVGITRLKDEIKRQEIIQENSKKIDNLFKDGVRLFMYGEYIRAKEKFEEILKIIPGHKESTEYLAKIEAQFGMVSATQINDIFLKGLDLYKKGEYEEALKYFEAVVIAAPQRTDAVTYIQLCRQQIKAREEEKQKEAVIKKQREVQNEMIGLFKRSLELYERDRYEEAYASFKKAFDMATEYKFENYRSESSKYLSTIRNILAERYFKEGFKLQQQNKLDAALESYRKSLTYNPNNTAVNNEIERILNMLAQQYYDQGMKFYASGEIDKAKDMLKKSLNYKDKEETRRALDRMK